MKKLFLYFATFVIAVVYFFGNFCEVSASSQSEILDAYAYQISLIKYNGSGNTQELGKMLVYNPKLFEQFESTEGKAPGNYDELKTGKGVGQIPPDPHVSGHSYSGGTDFGPGTLLGDNKALVVQDGLVTCEIENDPVDKCNNNPYQPTGLSSPTSGTMGWNNKLYVYDSNERKVTWLAPSTSGWYTAIADSNLTADNVNNHNYLDVLFDRYANTQQKIKQYFGVTINYREMEQYYIEFVPVERVKGDIISTGDRYVASTFYQTIKEPDSWSASTSDWNEIKHSDPYKCNCKDNEWSVCSSVANGNPSCGSARVCGGYTDSSTHTCFNCCETVCSTCYNNYSTYDLKTARHCGLRNKHVVYGYYATGSTYLRVVTSGSKLNRAVNLCSEEKNKHCELEDDNVTCKRDRNGNIIYQYYVGPNLEKALVGTEGYNKYKLQGSCTTQAPTTGRKEYYLITDWNDDCQRTCQASGSTRSDEYLKCAENYCDAEVDFELKGNARLRKKNCILSCGYVYGQNGESKDSCNNSNPYKGQERYYTGTSKCNINGERYQPMTGEQAVAVTCDGDNVTDFDNDDTNDTIFDTRKYINVACKESTSFGYLDISKLALNAGEDIEYIVNLLGEKECTVYFNLEQWKFDYATISSKDPDRRKRLMYIYEVFNRALDDTYTPNSSNNRYFDKDFLDEGNGEVDWESQKYDANKVSVMSKVTEIINNKEKQGTTQNLNRQEYTEKTDQNVWYKDNNDKANNYVTRISGMSLSTSQVNKYKSTSKVEAKYKFDKMCTTTDGKADAYKSNVDVCYTKKDGSSVFAKNTYYTSLAATPNKYFSEDISKAGKTHNIETNVTVGKDALNSNLYYNNTEKCEYKIKEPTEAQCKIIITPNQDTAKLGHDIYEGSGVTAKVWYYEELGEEDEVESVAMIVNNTRYETNERSIAIGSILNSNEEFNITGVVTTKTGKEIECPKTIIVMRHTSCGLGCTIARVGDKAENLYEIRSTGSRPDHYYQSLSTNMNKVEVFPSVADGRYYVRLNSALEEVTTTHRYNANILFGYVYTSSCNNYCRTNVEEQPDCTNMYKPSETGEIRTYCERNYQDDINNYESVEDCVMRCSNARECPDNRRDITEVRTFCKTNYLGLGYSEEIECVNRCYYNPKSKEDYIFRPVSQLDPFPNSEESYTPGNRVIGQNWYGGLSKYITEDNDDKTSVTGAGANQNVEYIIELNPQTIRKVRENSKDYGIAAYTDYIYAETYDEDYVGRYESKFIREDFRDLFKTSMESAGRTISALGELD